MIMPRVPVALPGVGERASELNGDIGLNDHIDAVVELIEENDLRDVILTGHSYGGSVITGVADRVPERIRTIVYLDAVHPSDGQNLLEAQPLMQYVPCVAQPQEVDGVMVNLLPGDDTLKFLGLVDPDDAAYGMEHLTPHPWKTFTDHLHLSDPAIVEKIGKVDIYTTTTINGLLQAKFATEDEARNAMVIESGHDLMITQPELIANMMLAIAADV